ncbi:hypothetical protein [Lentzea aerocolonigenes]|uniref:hypothetical protein n=1 Tax=Lentzea aerocolonigenes TaxID=68170 RepID=UPI001E5F810F|nr:hypothetical protein [Lentzea aerocolonigenes]
MVLVDDEQPVGELASDGADETFGVAVRPRTPRRDLHDVDPGVSENGIERGCELASSVSDHESEVAGPIAEAQEVACLLGCPAPVRIGSAAEDVDMRVPTSITKNTYTRVRVTTQSTWKKSHASMVAA